MIIALTACESSSKTESDGINDQTVSVQSETEQMSEYDTIFFGFPVWWYDLPMPMWTFLENFDFSSKTIIPLFLSRRKFKWGECSADSRTFGHRCDCQIR